MKFPDYNLSKKLRILLCLLVFCCVLLFINPGCINILQCPKSSPIKNIVNKPHQSTHSDYFTTTKHSTSKGRVIYVMPNNIYALYNFDYKCPIHQTTTGSSHIADGFVTLWYGLTDICPLNSQYNIWEIASLHNQSILSKILLSFVL